MRAPFSPGHAVPALVVDERQVALRILFAEVRQRPDDALGSRQAGTRAQGPQPHHEGERLVDGEAQRSGNRVGVANEDPAVLPVGLDEVVGQVTGRAAQEEQREVGLELVGAHPELLGRALRGDPLVGQQPRHHGEQPLQPRGRALLHVPGVHRRTCSPGTAPVCRAAASRKRLSTARCRSWGASTTTSGPKPATSAANPSMSR